MPNLMQSPLGDRDYATINRDLSVLERARVEIERALEAGFPCGEMDEACKSRRELLMKIKKVYFPDRP
jgi:hypothetical protein